MRDYIEEDDGTMPANVAALGEQVVGHRIVSVEHVDVDGDLSVFGGSALVITLDNGKSVQLWDTNDCCAYTELEAFLLNPDLVDHIITGVSAEDDYQTWHIYADLGDVLKLTVGWSSGNPFYYGYGFDINVVDEVAA